MRRLVIGLIFIAVLAATGTTATAAILSSAGVTHRVMGNGTAYDTFDAVIPISATSLNGMTLTVSGPGGFSYTFVNSDINPYLSTQLLVYKQYASHAPGF